jgi:hypothetical protein
MYTISYNMVEQPTPYAQVRWVHEYDANAEAVGVDVTGFAADEQAAPGVRTAWSVGTRIDVTDRLDVVVLQFDDDDPILQTPPAYPIGRLDWWSHWDAGFDDSAAAVVLADNFAGATLPPLIYVAVQSVSNALDPNLDYVVLKYNVVPVVPGGPKPALWNVRFDGPARMDDIAVSVGSAQMHDVPWQSSASLRFWLTGWTTHAGGTEWLTVQWKDPSP